MSNRRLLLRLSTLICRVVGSMGSFGSVKVESANEFPSSSNLTIERVRSRQASINNIVKC